MKRASAIALLLVACSAGGVDNAPTPSDVPSVTALSTAQSTATSTSPTASPESTPTPAPTEPTPEALVTCDTEPAAAIGGSPASGSGPPFPPNSMVKALVPGIVLRANPTIEGLEIGILPEGSRSFVVGGPWQADGFEWIAVSGTCVPLMVGCSAYPNPALCPTWQGYVATGASPSEPWLALDPTDCPNPESDPHAFMLLGDIEALHCYGANEIEFTAWITTVAEPEPCRFEPHPALWLACPGKSPALARATADGEVGLELFVDPESGMEFTRSGYWATITGRLDHPISQQCNLAVGVNMPLFGAAAILECRAHFVVTSLEVVAP